MKESLYHFGIKGMHWGIRRDRNKNQEIINASNKRERRRKNKVTMTLGGANMVTIGSVVAMGVLKRKPPQQILTNAVRTEGRILKKTGSVGVKTAKTIGSTSYKAMRKTKSVLDGMTTADKLLITAGIGSMTVNAMLMNVGGANERRK